jgi:hypothetical protein
MKKLTSLLAAFGLALPATFFLAGCEQTPQEEIQEEQQDVQEEQQDVQEEQKDVLEEQQDVDKAKSDALQPNGTQPNGAQPGGAGAPKLPTTPPGDPEQP